MKQNPLIPPLQSDVGQEKRKPTIADLGKRTISELGTVSEPLIVDGGRTVVMRDGKPHLLIQVQLPNGTVKVGIPVTIELIAFLRAVLKDPPP